MARTNPYMKAEVLEVLEADEGENEAEPESPLSPSSTGSEDESESLIESPRKKMKVSESQVVPQTPLRSRRDDHPVGGCSVDSCKKC